jgi:hypothetical protein
MRDGLHSDIPVLTLDQVFVHAALENGLSL